MSLFSITYPILMVLMIIIVTSRGSVRFTNVKCVAYDPPFATLDTCELKVLQRGVVGMNIDIHLQQGPVTNVTINLSLHRKSNGYQSFLYNVTADFCEFMRRRSKYPLLQIFFNALTPYSNVNHSCPFNHHVIIRNWILKEEDFRLLPLPVGDYKFMVKVDIYDERRFDVSGFFSIIDDFGRMFRKPK